LLHRNNFPSHISQCLMINQLQYLTKKRYHVF
jgi:hypothetical protein